MHRIPATTPACTLIDIAMRLDRDELEAAINAADRRDLIDPEMLRSSLVGRAGRPGVGPLRATLDRRTFMLTDSQLERRFLPIARAAGLPPPLTQQWVNGFRVDFCWPDLGLVVETYGLRYHPHAGAAGLRPNSRPSARRRRNGAAAVHSGAGPIRARARARDVAEVARRLRSM